MYKQLVPKRHSVVDARRRVSLLTFIALGVSLSACAMLNKKQEGAIIGAGVGGTVGAVVGNQTGSTARGAIIGAVVLAGRRSPRP